MRNEAGRLSGAALVALCLLLLGPAVEAQSSCSIQGLVIASSGRPVASVWVLLIRGGQEGSRSLTGDDGRYYMGGLGPGSYTIAVKQGQTRLFEATVTLRADERYDIRLP